MEMGTRTLKITPEFLREHDACDQQVILFESWLKRRGWKSARLTLRNLQSAEKFGLPTSWLWASGVIPLEDWARDLSVSMGPRCAYRYALYVDRDPRDNTRRAVGTSPLYAYLYACHIERVSHEDTRKAVCASPGYAYLYALNIDRSPRSCTRRTACRDPRRAYLYARYVDKSYREDTYRAARKHAQYAHAYEKTFGMKYTNPGPE